MKRLLLAVVGALGLWTTQAAAQTTTYYVQSAPYDMVSNFTACPQGGCSTVYTTSQRLSGSFTIFGALTPDMVDVVVAVRVGDLDFNDGQNTYQMADWDWSIVPQSAQVSTDSDGNLTYFEFKFDKLNGIPATAGDSGDPRSYVSSIYFYNTFNGGSGVYVQTNSLCTLRGDNVDGDTLGQGCAMQDSDPAQGASAASAPSVAISLTPFPPPPPPAIPTLTEWAMILLGGLLAAGAVFQINRRRTA